MAHALLSPSSASRWLACPPSARLEAQFPDNAGEYAQEGTIAHEMCEVKLLRQQGRPVGKRLADIRLDPLFTGEMEDHAEEYADFVFSRYLEAKKATPDAKLLIEEQIDLRNYVPEGFGTADAVIIADGVATVIDYKYGKGVEVSAVRNKQMMLYAIGVLTKHDMLYGIDQVRMVIFQPRLGNVSEYEMTARDLYEWAETELRTKAQLAFQGAGQFSPGGHCRFCRAKTRCRSLAIKCLTTAQLDDVYVPLLTPEEIGAILSHIPLIKSWAASVEEYALNTALDGKRIPGFKLVEGRSVRKYGDEKKVAQVLMAQGFKDSQIFKPRELQTVTAMEKLLTKKGFNSILGDLIIKPAGKPTLVALDDKRPEWSSAEADFKNINI